jgi:ABC-2 type transport system permease protein
MKALDIALKDITQSFRSKAALVFMFVVPLLITGMFFLIFGSAGDGDESFSIATIPVVVVNLDQNDPYGSELVKNLQAESLRDLLVVEEVFDPQIARERVDKQQAAVALIIPENFSQVVIGDDTKAEIEFYQDPTLALGPNIVNLVISQFMDGYSGSRIAVGSSIESLIERGEPITEEMIAGVVSTYVARISSGGDTHQLVSIQNPSGEETETSFSATSFIGYILGGMMVFYAFFTGANMAMTILHEEEKGTLPRLFTTPTHQATILNGKFLSTGTTIIIQVLILLGFGWLIFGVNWGSIFNLLLFWLVITACAAGFGIFVNSLLKNSKQAGMVFGGVVTVTGMIGMAPIFVMGAPGASQVVNKLALLVPQGWVMRVLQLSMDGGDLRSILPYAGVSLLWAAVFFFIGNARFKRRYI